MTFENIDTELLKNALNSCIESINYSKSSQIITDITGNNIWQTSSRDNFKRAMENLVNVKYKKLENKLREYLKLVTEIEKYKSVSGDIASMQMKLQMLNDELAGITEENNNIQSSITELNSNIKSKENELAILKGSMEA